jgi:hypothetical protein
VKAFSFSNLNVAGASVIHAVRKSRKRDCIQSTVLLVPIRSPITVRYVYKSPVISVLRSDLEINHSNFFLSNSPTQLEIRVVIQIPIVVAGLVHP